MTRKDRLWAVVPAAGVGRRMGADRPKQYLPLCGATVIEHTLRRLLAFPPIQAVVVAVGRDDPYWRELNLADSERVHRAPGGAERCHSVLNALELLAEIAGPADWVLVHDAARPCLTLEDLERLVARARTSVSGGILAVPVRDTLKRDDAGGHILETVDRSRLWHALTPQMFRLGPLREALREALGRNLVVTDEASAMEYAGHRPLLIEGRGDNIKITRPEDLALAEFFLHRQRGYG
ncbi:MAG TPA: 2-C-methyl-D-erythritol 4-phosphate cytidylyltransferase [Chromatiales bacterium]|nr:2-C-methyl-D-erythritol 4-phosphate cytidylyltransferase [Chromatiales bacterium]